ncbi:MAG: cell division protein ZapA [Lachnospiraceae bacterium]|nr:cell division protein ZapA [Lachnospiraceae bacterium]
MKTRNDVVVTINNKEYVIAGYESDEYLQKIAAYMNRKYKEFKEQPFYGRLNSDMRTIMLEINMADDYFKAMDDVSKLEEQLLNDSQEIFRLKHELMNTEKKLKQVQEELKKKEELF